MNDKIFDCEHWLTKGTYRLKARLSAFGYGIGVGLSNVTKCLKTRSLGIGGQATVEYVIVSLACIGLVVALGVFASRLEEGLFIKHAIESASHSVRTNIMGAIGDVLLY